MDKGRDCRRHPMALDGTVRIQELESLRGIAALLIVIYHMPKWNGFLDVGIIENSYLLVDLFFVLSGFVIYRAYSNKISSTKSLFVFQFLRFGRLYPVHLLFLLIYMLMEIAKYLANVRYGLQGVNTRPFAGNNAVAFVENIFLVQAIGPTGNAFTFNYVVWSISVEFYAYAVFGAVILLAKRRHREIFTLFSIVSLIFLLSKPENISGFDFLLRCFSGFFMGCLTAIAAAWAKPRMPGSISLMIALIIGVYLQEKTRGYSDTAMFFLSSALIFSVVCSKSGFLGRLLNFSPMIWLGSVSYSVYMCHPTVELMANQFVRIVLKRPGEFIHGRQVPQLPFDEALIAVSLTVIAVMIVSMFVGRYVEMPFRAKSRQLASRWVSRAAN